MTSLPETPALPRPTASIDHILGPAEKRFFGDGHRRVRYRFDDARVLPGPPGVGEVTATAAVLCPPDWSTKGAVAQRPHLSTVDALIVGARLAEVFLAVRHRMTDLERAAMWLRRVEIKAGNAPDEDNLEQLEVAARLKATRPDQDDPTLALSVLECHVGAMRVRCDVVHSAGRPTPDPAAEAPVDLSGLPAGIYGEGFRHRRQPITDVLVEPGSLRATATAQVFAEPGPHSSVGIEGAYQPSVSLVDAFVIALQLGQVLIYDLDQVDRAHSRTLWMRRTVLEAEDVFRPAGGPMPVVAELLDATLLNAQGTAWRTADITSSYAGVRVRCAVTHELAAGHHRAADRHEKGS
jgi:hypothetical protein